MRYSLFLAFTGVLVHSTEILTGFSSLMGSALGSSFCHLPELLLAYVNYELTKKYGILLPIAFTITYIIILILIIKGFKFLVAGTVTNAN